MKKLSFFLMAMLISLVSFAQDAPVYELYPVTGSNNSYAGNCDVTVNGIKWNLTGNSTMDPWRIGGKSITKVDRALYSKTPLAYNIDKIEVTHGTASSITVNSFKLIISDEANGAGETIDVAFKASATTTIDLPEGDYTNKYFKFLYNVTVSGSSNKFVQFVGAKFYAALAEDAVKAPIITGAEDFISETEVTIEAEDDVTVYYTLDGTEPTTASTVYTAPFTVKETTTVKAVAYRGETASFVTSATFTQATRVTAAEAAQLAMKVASNNAMTSVTYVIDAYVTSVIDQSLSSGQQRFWVADTKNGGQVLQSYYCNVPRVLKVGEYIQMFGKLTKYNTSPQMKNGDVTILPEPVVNYNITVSANPAEGGVVTGGGEFEETEEITVKAVANENYAFVNWTENDVEVSTAAEYTFEVLDDRDLVANFQLIPCTQATPVKWTETIALEANADKWYLVDVAEAVAAEKDLTLTVNNTSEEDVELTIDSYTTCPTDELDRVLASTKTIKAGETYVKDVNFVKYLQGLVDQVYLHVTTVGGAIEVKAETAKFNVTATAENGTVEGAGIYEQGAEATLTATPAEGYEFVNWTSGETVVSTENPYKFTVTADVALVANFKKAAPATETVYFINTKKWAAVTAHAWGAKLPDTAWPGLATVKETEKIAGFDVYSFTANVGDYANVIFNNKGGGSQTPDLVWTAGKYYVIDMGWLTKEEAEAKLATPLPETWNVVGDAGLMGKGWDLNAAENAMTKQADGTYKLEKKGITLTAGTYEYKAAKDHDWAVAVPQDGNQKLTISKSGIYDITFVLDVTAKKLTATATLKQEAVVIPTVIIAGDMNSWNQTKDKFTMSADSLTATFKATLTAKSYGFKMIVGGAWLSDGKTITRTANSHKFTGANGGNSTLKTDIAGEYLFTWEYATKTLTVTYPALPVKYNVTVTAENGTVTGAGAYEEGKTATLTATPAEGYKFLNWTVGDSIVSTENPYSFVVTADIALVANFEKEPEIEWIPMDLEIANLVTEVMEVEGAKYLRLQGRDDMNDADVMLFLNNYADVDDDYEVNTESSFMTFGGLELTVLEGVMTQTSETDKGTIYTGTVRASVEEEGETMYVEFALTMYAAPATVLVLTDAIVAINEELGTLTFNVPTGDGEGYYAELAGYTAPGVHEGPQICLFMTPEAVAYTNYAETSVADGIITLKGEFVSPMGPKFDVTISGKLPEVEKPELPAASVRAWAYDLALAVEGEQYTFSYKATTAALATLILTDAEGVELATKDLGLVEAGANTAVLAASELPAGEKVNWAIKLEAGAIAEFTEVTDASRGIYNFYLPQGVAVDNNPESATFGTIYVAAATDGASDGSSDRADTQKRGIFIYDQELNELNPTSNVGIVPSNVTFGATSRQVMKRLVINPATNEVAFAHNAAPMAVWAVPAENVGGEAKNLIEGLGFTNVNSICFTEDGTLYVLESNGYPAPGSLYKVANGVVDTIFAGYTRFGNGDNALVSDNRGGVWICQNRGQLDTYNQLTHVNAAGEIDFEVNTATPNGFESMNTARGTIAYNPAEDILAMSIGTGSTIGASLYKVTYDEATGVPALTLIGSTPSMGKNVDGLAFDYAGDLYGLSANKERLYKYAVPTENNVCVTPAAAKYAFEIELAPAVEVVGTVKRAVQNGDEVIVLTHEADGTAHIYQVVDGVAVAEVSLEGVVPVDPENKGSYLAISDIAVTEDGKLVANNYVRNQFAGTTPEAGYKLGTSYYYIWNDLAGAPAVWFTSQTTARSSHGDVGVTFALKGTSTNAELLVTAVHNNNRAVRLAKYNIIDGQYVEPNIPGGQQSSEYYEYFGTHTKEAYYQEAVQGKQFQLNVSPLGDNNWIMDGELVDPSEFVLPGVGENYAASATLTEDLGKKYNGASYITVDGAAYMVAPFANPDGQLVGVEILNITNGFDAPQYVNMVYVDEAVAVEAAATAVQVVEGGLNITLVADNTIQTWFVELNAGGDYEVYEDEISNLVIDLDNLVLIGGPSSAFQVDVYLQLGEYNMSEDSYQLTAESSIAVMGSDATFIEGYAYEVDAFTPSAKAVVRCEWNGMKFEFHLTMTAEPMEATVVVVENATVEIEKYVIFGDMYDYALKMTGEWVNEADGLTYPVLVEVPVYYPEATEPSEIMSTVTVGGWGDNDPWLGFGEGTLTVTTVDGVVTATGIVQNPMAGVAIDITISGKLPQEPVKYTVTATVNPAEAGTVEGAGEYEENAEATLIATAAEGYEFVNWTVAGEEVSTDATYTFTVTADVEVVANFKAKVGTGVANIQTGIKAVKTIKNGQLIISKDGKEYNAQGAQLK